MKEHDLKLFSLISEYQRIERSKKRIASIKRQLSKERERLTALNKMVIKEYADLAELESKPIVPLFAKILRDHERQLEKERQEYLLAVIEYRESKKLIELFEFELKILKNNLVSEVPLMAQIKKSIDEINDFTKYKNSAQLRTLKSVIAQISSLTRLKIEVIEVLHVAGEIKSNFSLMIEALKKAREFDTWGKFYNEIQHGKQLKKSHLDEAQAHAYIVKKLLTYLNDELEDVTKLNNQFEYDEPILFQYILKYHRNLISDWVNDENLKYTLTTTVGATFNLESLEKALIMVHDKSEVNLEKARQKRKHILDTLVNN